MVGSLNLTHVCDGDPLEMSRTDRDLDRGLDRVLDRGLDSPDSGLPSSPSPSAWLLPADKAGGSSPESEDEGRGSKVPVLPGGCVSRLQPMSYSEGISLHPLPPTEIRYTSSVHYDSHRHFIQVVTLQPSGRGLDLCSQTVMAAPGSTWRRYRTQLDFSPRLRPQTFRTTSITYVKTTRNEFSTEINVHELSTCRRFMASVELQAAPL